MRDAGGQLAERGKLFGLNEAVLRRSQFLKRLRQFAGTSFNAFEQTHVFDCNHGLIRESCYQINFTLHKRVHSTARQRDNADRFALPHEWYAYNRAYTSYLSLWLFLIKRISPGIVDSDDLSAHGGTADGRPRSRCNWRLLLDLQIRRIDTMAGRKAVDFTLWSKDHRLISTAEPRRSVYNALKDWLQLELGAADDAKYL